jgi:hypothetical protein
MKIKTLEAGGYPPGLQTRRGGVLHSLTCASKLDIVSLSRSEKILSFMLPSPDYPKTSNDIERLVENGRE